jgi:hypothetical protein
MSWLKHLFWLDDNVKIIYTANSQYLFFNLFLIYVNFHD